MKRTVRLDIIACDGHGICAQAFPERIRLDDWGYPIVDPTPLTPDLERDARRAIASCPTLALIREAAESGRPRPRRVHRTAS